MTLPVPYDAKTWMVCPGSVAMNAAVPDKPRNADRTYGIAAHWLAKSALERFREGVPFTWSTMTGYPCPETNTPIPEDMIGYSRDYVDYAINVAGINRERVRVEQRVDLSMLLPGMYGKSDLSVFHPDRRHLDVLDAKFGEGRVIDAEENAQGVCYLIGEAAPYLDQIDTVSFHIAQPRRCDEPTIWTFDRDTLDMWTLRMRAAAKATQQPDAPRIATPEGCRACRGREINDETGKPYCPEYYAEQQDAVAVAEAGGSPPPKIADMVELMTELSRCVAAEALIKARVSALTAWATQQADMWGRETPGYKLIQRRSTRRWRDPDELVAVLMYGYGLTEEQIYTRSLLSPAKLEDLRDAEGNKIVARDVVFSYTEKDDNGVELVPVSDKRTAIAPRSIAIPDGLTPFVQNKE